jgi:hypothetical protein
MKEKSKEEEEVTISLTKKEAFKIIRDDFLTELKGNTTAKNLPTLFSIEEKTDKEHIHFIKDVIMSTQNYREGLIQLLEKSESINQFVYYLVLLVRTAE